MREERGGGKHVFMNAKGRRLTFGRSLATSSSPVARSGPVPVLAFAVPARQSPTVRLDQHGTGGLTSGRWPPSWARCQHASAEPASVSAFRRGPWHFLWTLSRCICHDRSPVGSDRYGVKERTGR